MEIVFLDLQLFTFVSTSFLFAFFVIFLCANKKPPPAVNNKTASGQGPSIKSATGVVQSLNTAIPAQTSQTAQPATTSPMLTAVSSPAQGPVNAKPKLSNIISEKPDSNAKQADGQEALKNLSVLVVGCGGLGCPVASYLAAAGIGRLGLVDHDEVSLDNLHRQIVHDESRVGVPKVESMRDALKRYLVNDACILMKKPLVSGSALGWEGQLTTCPCYRCLFPKPPPPESVTNCSEGGVLGPVTGVIGSMQALEVIKIAISKKSTLAGSLFHFDGLEGRTRMFYLRDRNAKCAVTTRHLLSEDQRISIRDFAIRRLDPTKRPLLIDTRPPLEYEICHLPEALNFPLDELEAADRSLIETKLRERNDEIFVICHRGNDSQLAVKLLREKLSDSGIRFRDVIGGLDAYSRDVDCEFPIY
ncbi:Adenylyltransferase and sulfurtransferase MOCS3 [Aphelenchoides besseyi]|nr:Adenylyltransferase and sulfurtransferase MOCS3 [Aphelenchoides besseyi]KAI6194512.1 Adenylyltransferase and sulfurtransferase MOCS3 [Aphelenchoides besseyi]